MVEYVWKRGKWVANDTELGKDLIATSPTGDILSLNRLRCDAASEMLGVWLAPDGNHIQLWLNLKSPLLNGE